MKRWNQQAIELLRKQSEQSRNGEPVTPGNNIALGGTSASIKVSVGEPGAPPPENGVALDLSDRQGRRFQLRITRRGRRK